MTEAEKAYQYFVIAVPENEEQAKAYFWARKALRPVSREQVEKVWRGKWIGMTDDDGCTWYECSRCEHDLDSLEEPNHFCPACGAPMTDEAVEMVMERMGPSMNKTTINRIWPGCDFCKKELNDYPFITAIGEYGDSIKSHTPQYCPLCGRPLTPEAWKEMKKKLEALKDGSTAD